MIRTYTRLTTALDRADWLLPTLARVVFVGVLLLYFWVSDTAYMQIFPKAVEAAGYDAAQLGWGYRLAAVLGTWAEFLLPLCIAIGLMTRLSALGMIVFVAVQSYVDIYGHDVGAKTTGAWFDHISNAAIVDQRALWVLLLMILAVKGAGPLSLDAALRSARRAEM